MDIQSTLYIIRLLLPMLASLLFRIYALGCKKKRVSLLLTFAYCVFIYVISGLVIHSIGFETYTYFSAALALLPLIALVPLISSDPPAQTYFMYLISVNIVLIMTASANIICVLFGFGQIAVIILMLAMYIPAFLAAKKYFVKPLRFMSDFIQGNWWLLNSVPILTYFCVIVITTFSPERFSEKPVFGSLISLIIEIAYFMYVYSTYKSFVNINSLSMQTKSSDLMHVQIKALQQRVKTLDEAQKQSSILQHDRRHFNNLLLVMLKSGKTDEAITLLEEMDSKFAVSPKKYCLNPMVNAAVSFFAGLAEQSGIEFIAEIDIPETLRVESTELSIVISNLLENALHACTKLDETDNRYISLRSKNASKLLLEIENSCLPSVRLDAFGNPAPTMRGNGHGIGSRSVAAFADRNNAQVEYFACDGVFRVRLAI